MNLKPKRRSPQPWTPEEDAIIRELGSSKSATYLGGLITNHSVESIKTRRRKLKVSGLAVHNNRKLDQSITIDDLDNLTYQTLIGSLFGDASLVKHKETKDFRVSEFHGVYQTDYLRWKSNLLSPLAARFSSGGKLPYYYTPCHHLFTKLRDDFYPERKDSQKILIPAEHLEKLDWFGFFIWFLDCGCAPQRGGWRISAKRFGPEKLCYIVDILNKNLGLKLEMKGWYYNNCTINMKNDYNHIRDTFQGFAEEYNLSTDMWYKIKYKDYIEPPIKKGKKRKVCSSSI